MFKRPWLLTASLLALGGCGGGNSAGNVTVVPGSPTPSPATPTPTPGTPTPTPSTLAQIATGATASGTSQFLTVTGSTQNFTGGSTSGRSVTGYNAAISFAYDASARTYTLRNEQRTQAFGPPISNETSLPDYFPRVEYQASAAGSTDYLVLFKQPNASPAIATNYAAYGAWQHNSALSSGTAVRLDYFVYGTPTPASAMPHSGVATYRLFGTGNYADDTRLYFAQSYCVVTVDFATGRVTTQITLTGSDFLTGSFGGLLGASYTGQISGNAADGALGFGPANSSGTARVAFFGPNAENIGIIYSGTYNGAATFNGAGAGTTP